MTVLPVTSENGNQVRRKLKKCSKDLCGVKTVKKRLPITEWLPEYNLTKLIQDIIAGITVGLTAIPQGIAYAVVAGLSPEYGLYAGLMGGFVYLFFGSCKDVTVGPTAIMSAMVSKYVSGYSADFAVLAAFVSGLVELGMGILQLGFMVEFISMPVISGFTTAAALQIAAGQLKSIFGLDGKSGNYFAESVYNFVYNFKSMKVWDPILGFSTIGILLVLKNIGQGCSRTDGLTKQLRWFVSLGRNAVVVIIGMIIAYLLKISTGTEPLILIGDIGSGLPKIEPPPFSTTVGNETYTFSDMMSVLGPQSLVLPLVAILESVAIAKAFAGGKPVDATQEMMALGMCNIVGSFTKSMPITGSFTRTAINNASGVQTPAGGVFTGFLILLALSLLTSTFYFIPKASLAGLIITAMFSMIDFDIFGRLWRNSKIELLLILITMAFSLSIGLEYGIVAGIVVNAAILLYTVSQPSVEITTILCEEGEYLSILLPDKLPYCAADHVRKKVLHASQNVRNAAIVINGSNVKKMDSTVASNLMSVIQDLDKTGRKVIFLNFSNSIVNLCLDINPKYTDRFVIACNSEDVLIKP
ncbi:sodium-independent sulfate anion transporter-like [Cydia pomonella]|uniref:sodium-independent sulfate anion transporter-like n=1 Tax=Cydia pomonella TaxID=82600 RepID=UPI002ADE63D9|nr:sodium-independent sulfate anion transporter-like [Cydia pomonella]